MRRVEARSLILATVLLVAGALVALGATYSMPPFVATPPARMSAWATGPVTNNEGTQLSAMQGPQYRVLLYGSLIDASATSITLRLDDGSGDTTLGLDAETQICRGDCGVS